MTSNLISFRIWFPFAVVSDEGVTYKDVQNHLNKTVSDNKLTDDGAKQLFKVLKDNGYLTLDGAMYSYNVTFDKNDESTKVARQFCEDNVNGQFKTDNGFYKFIVDGE